MVAGTCPTRTSRALMGPSASRKAKPRLTSEKIPQESPAIVSPPQLLSNAAIGADSSIPADKNSAASSSGEQVSPAFHLSSMVA